MRCPRFSLRTLLAAMGIVAVLLAISQVHRRRLLREAADLHADGANFAIVNGWVDVLWMRHPDSAGITLEYASPTEVKIASRTYTKEAATAHVSELENRLKTFVKNDVHIFMVDREHTITRIAYPQRENQAEELDQAK